MLDELHFKLTFAKDPSNSKKLVSGMLGTIGAQFVNIENAHINLSRISLNNFSGPANTLVSNIGKMYKEQVLGNILFLLGAIDVIGNPGNLFNELFGGLNHFVNDVSIDGSKVLVKQGIGAISGFTSKITGNISNYLSLATCDNEYINQKKDLK